MDADEISNHHKSLILSMSCYFTGIATDLFCLIFFCFEK